MEAEEGSADSEHKMTHHCHVSLLRLPNIPLQVYEEEKKKEAEKLVGKVPASDKRGGRRSLAQRKPPRNKKEKTAMKSVYKAHIPQRDKPSIQDNDKRKHNAAFACTRNQPHKGKSNVTTELSRLWSKEPVRKKSEMEMGEGSGDSDHKLSQNCYVSLHRLPNILLQVYEAARKKEAEKLVGQVPASVKRRDGSLAQRKRPRNKKEKTTMKSVYKAHKPPKGKPRQDSDKRKRNAASGCTRLKVDEGQSTSKLHIFYGFDFYVRLFKLYLKGQIEQRNLEKFLFVENEKCERVLNRALVQRILEISLQKKKVPLEEEWEKIESAATEAEMEISAAACGENKISKEGMAKGRCYSCLSKQPDLLPLLSAESAKPISNCLCPCTKRTFNEKENFGISSDEANRNSFKIPHCKKLIKLLREMLLL